MPAERNILALLLAAALPVAFGAANAADAPPAPPATPRAAPPLSAADAELLEFLGEFDDAKGEFVDPFVIDEVSNEVAAASRETAGKQKQVAAPATQAAPQAQPEKKP